MPDPRPASLLDFAIAASIAVVPVMLAVLLAIGAPVHRAVGDSHLSVRQVAALKTFEHAIVRRDIVHSDRPSAAVLTERIPECSAEWTGQDRFVDRLRQLAGVPRGDAANAAQRIANHLSEIDAALRRMNEQGNRRVVDPAGFDVVRWTDAARRTLGAAVETPRYPQRRFFVRCSDLAAAAATLARARGRMLATLAWRGTEAERTTARWRPEQVVEISARQLARNNPWDGIPGCVYLLARRTDGEAPTPAFTVMGSRASERVCTQATLVQAERGEIGRGVPVAIAGEPGDAAAADDPRWHVPPSLSAMLRPLESLQRTSGALYRAYTETGAADRGAGMARRRPNQVVVDGAPVDVGFSVDLTIDPALQALAQKAAACYTGRQDVCQALGIARAEDAGRAVGDRLLERAMVRMAAIAIIDVPSGRIEALAGGMSPCTRQEYDGPGRSADCDRRIPYPIGYRPDALLNPAVFVDAMPASVVKPVMAAAFLTAADVGPRWLAAERAAMRSPMTPAADSMRGQLMRSNSARFLDRMFCGDEGFRPCERVWQIQTAASAFGWNAGCDAPSERCGHRDLLFGGAHGRPELSMQFVYGRLLVEPAGAISSSTFRMRAPVALDTAKIKRCAAGVDGRRASGDDWEKCSGGTVVDVVAEGWGQGHARSTALGAAGMMAALASAANGELDVRQPHLVSALRGTAGNAFPALHDDVIRWRALATGRNTVSRDAAEVILSGLAHSHRSGTARRACEQVFEARECREIDWIAGKTGTPTFPNDDRSLDELATLCAVAAKRTRREQIACSLRPYKWYVAAYRTDRTVPAWNKVIGVLVERNWFADSGRIHGAGDHGPNPAAELAFQIVGRHMRELAGESR